ncbi:hypothetical protein DFH06DRAFT_1310845 [Mycena polygramma]|nr:hypothetical protein DFH06DRAFT_1310845 [Mycena polygramma]
MNNPYASSDFAANNPFVPDPQSRYPDLNASPAHDPSATQFTTWLQPGAQSPMGMQNQQQPPFQQQPFQQQSISPQFSQGYLPQQGFAPQSPSQFQPSSAFGQQLAGQVNGSSYGYLQAQRYIAQFDPYSSIGQGWEGQVAQQQQQQQQQQGQGQQGQGQPSSAPQGQLHPREYLRIPSNKAQIEKWDSYAWKQLLNAFDALKDAWEKRRKEVEGNIAQLQQQMQYGGYHAGQIQQEVGRLQAMHEVFANYRQSADRIHYGLY